MGMGASDIQGRIAASIGELDAVAPSFSPALDVPNCGVLFALPALLAVGLLANASSDQAIGKLCEEFNATKTRFPRTNLRLVLKLGST